MRVMVRIGTHGTCPSLCLMLRARHTLPSNMPAWYLLQLDPWQLSLKYSNSATELLGDSVAQLVRAWQPIILPGRGFESRPESLSFSPGNETNLPRIGFCLSVL